MQLVCLNEHASRLELQMFRAVVEGESEVGMKVRISDVCGSKLRYRPPGTLHDWLGKYAGCC